MPHDSVAVHSEAISKILHLVPIVEPCQYLFDLISAQQNEALSYRSADPWRTSVSQAGSSQQRRERRRAV